MSKPEKKPKAKRGFAAMDPEKQKEIASKGGKAAHEQGTAHQFTPAEAKKAGKKGGKKVSSDRKHMSEIGRKGGKAAHRNGTAHEFTPAEAAEAGRKGGNVMRKRRKKNKEQSSES